MDGRTEARRSRAGPPVQIRTLRLGGFAGSRSLASPKEFPSHRGPHFFALAAVFFWSCCRGWVIGSISVLVAGCAVGSFGLGSWHPSLDPLHVDSGHMWVAPHPVEGASSVPFPRPLCSRVPAPPTSPSTCRVATREHGSSSNSWPAWRLRLSSSRLGISCSSVSHRGLWLSAANARSRVADPVGGFHRLATNLLL